MTTVSLDFTSAYRAITDADILPILTRDPFGWDGKGEPEAAVTLTDNKGVVTTIPAYDSTDGLPVFFIKHSPNANQFDLVSLFNKTVLRFEIPVDGAPLWENYVKAAYTGDGEINQFFVDNTVYNAAFDNWVGYVLTHEFQASAAALSDKGGALGQFTSSDALLVEQFTNAPGNFAVNIHGSGFNDKFSGGDFNDSLSGNAGNDTIYGNAGDDLIIGGNGDDALSGQLGADSVYGNTGADLLIGAAGNDRLDGAEGNDTVYGDDGSDSISGGTADDKLYGGTGDDSLNGFTGNDTILGDDGNDSLNGGADNDELSGDGGNDSVWGGAGFDHLVGGNGNDSLSGGSDDDLLSGGPGKDTMTGGEGVDRFLFRDLGPANADKITDFAHGEDKILLASGTFAGVHAAVDTQEFRFGTAAQDGDDRILYDPASGRLYYDPDGTLHGTSSAPPVLFAIIVNHALLTFDDFIVV